MRMTNKIMQNNSLNNINTVKTLEDFYNTQLATGKKITKPSDDPVIAIRALKFRTNVSETEQFYKKNVQDAKSWMNTTEEALTNVSKLITDIYEQCTKEVGTDNTSADLAVRLKQMREYADEVMKNGNADFAGRYLFSGYRTGSTLTFESDAKIDYHIQEDTHGNVCFDSVRYVNYDAVDGVAKGHDNKADKNDISYCDVHRIQLAYKGVDMYKPDTVPQEYVDFNIKIATGAVPHTDLKTGITSWETKYTYLNGAPAGATDVDMKDDGTGTGTMVEKEFQFATTDASGNPIMSQAKFEVVSVYANPVKDSAGTAYTDANGKPYKSVYEYVADHKDVAVLVPETGELLLGKDLYVGLHATTEVNVDGNEWDETEMVIDYHKTKWDKGDSKPEHFYTCEAKSYGSNVTIKYNDEVAARDQEIAYDVGLSQIIPVNTNAADVFDHGIVRTIDELEDALAKFEDIERYKNDLDEKVKSDASYQDQYDAVCKAYDLMKDKMKNMFSAAITRYQKYLDKANLATTNAGARGSRLELVENRLASQYDTLRDLQSLNEDADETETAINLSSSNTAYEAALMATSKLVSTSLLNYI